MVTELGWCTNFLGDILDLVYLRFALFKECIKAQRILQHLGCGICLEKLEEMFLNTFHCDKFFDI